MQIEKDGKCYRRLKPPHDSNPGLWQMLFKGEWCKVINYQIRCDLNKLIESGKHKKANTIYLYNEITDDTSIIIDKK